MQLPRLPVRRLTLPWILTSAAAWGCGTTPRQVVATSADTLTLALVGTTDVHGNLLPWDYALGEPAEGSLAQAATLIDSLRATADELLLFDGGDLLQGTPLDEYEAQVGPDSVHPAIAAMNEMGYDAAAIGNHEFNYGIPYLNRVLVGARFPFLGANVRHARTGSAAYPGLIVIETASGVRVGVTGLTTPGTALWDRSSVEGRLRFEGIVETARRMVDSLRELRSDVIVGLVHSGIGPGSSYGEAAGVGEENAVRHLAERVRDIDVIFAGHSHRLVSGERIGRTLVVNAGSYARHVALVRVSLVPTANGGWSAISFRPAILATAGRAAAPRIVARIRSAHERTLAWLEEPIGFTPDHWTAKEARFLDTPIADLINRAQMEASGANVASTAVFRTRAGFGPGPITRRDILGLYVYPNTLKAVRMTGADLKAYLEWSGRYYQRWPAARLENPRIPGYNFDILSGVEYALDVSRSPGERVVRLRRRGRPVAPTDTIVIAVNSYRQSGGGGAEMVARAPVVFSTERLISDLLIEYIAERDTLRASDVFRENWMLRPAAAVAALAEKADSARDQAVQRQHGQEHGDRHYQRPQE